MDDIFKGFTPYQPKPVVRMAMRVDHHCAWLGDNRFAYCGVEFTANVAPEPGDYIARISLEDTYHVPKAVFEERHVVPPAGGYSMPTYPG